MSWKWFPVSVDGAAAGIAPSQVFRGRSVEQVVARETIQNSWDASRHYLRDDPSHLCLVKFEFRSLDGSDKARLIETLSLGDLADRVSDDDSLGVEVGGGSWIEALDSDAPLTVLYVSDFGPHGLYGHPSLCKESPLWLAMRATSITDKKNVEDDASGGSFGLGKGALLYASHAGVVVAYSRFDPFRDDPVTRRLEAAARWPDHAFDSEDWTGQARFGDGADAEPFADADADRVAEALGMPSRMVEDRLPFPGANPRGTTFMIVDPRLDPTLLRPAIEEFWWPALAPGEYADNLLVEVEIDGEIDNPSLVDDGRRDELEPYLTALDLAQGREQAAGQHQRRVVLRDRALGELGNLGLVMLTTDADEEEDDDDVVASSTPETLHTQPGSVIGLTRAPRMVVQYHVRNTRRNVRGVFVAHPGLDAALKASEPPTHDAWGDDPRPDGVNVGVIVTKEINKALRDFARDARPPHPPGEARIPALDKWLGQFGGGGSAGGERDKRPFQIQGPDGERISVEILRRPADPPDTIRARVTFRARLNPEAQLDAGDVEASVAVSARHLDETDKPIKDLDSIGGSFSERPFTFEEVRPGVVRGRLKQDVWFDFRWESDPYERDSRVGCAVEVEY